MTTSTAAVAYRRSTRDGAPAGRDGPAGPVSTPRRSGHIPILGTPGRDRLRGRRDRHELEDAPAEELQDVSGAGGQVRQPACRTAREAAPWRARPCARPGIPESAGARWRRAAWPTTMAVQRGDQRQLRCSRAARLEHEDRARLKPSRLTPRLPQRARTGRGRPSDCGTGSASVRPTSEWRVTRDG